MKLRTIILILLVYTGVIASLYQLEMIYIASFHQACYELPFYLLRCESFTKDWNLWNTSWRDFYYASILLNFFLLLIILSKPACLFLAGQEKKG